MRISSVHVHNFRKLYDCNIDFSNETTLFIGANNSGKTSAIEALGKFLGGRAFTFNDITISNRDAINEIGDKWAQLDCEKPESVDDWKNLLPSMDVCLDINPSDIHYVIGLIPTLKWHGEPLGVRLVYQPKEIGTLFSAYREAFFAARETEKSAEKSVDKVNINIFPKNLCDFLDKKIRLFFAIKPYILNLTSYNADTSSEIECNVVNPLKGLIRVDIIDAQRYLSDPEGRNRPETDHTRLSSKIRSYYDNYLDPEKYPSPEDLLILEATEQARISFDATLEQKLKPAIAELEKLGYPGVTNPLITIKSKPSTLDMLKHDSAIQYSVGEKEEGLMLPEKYNGLGYQNLISILFDLISYRDGWMRKGKSGSKQEVIEPIHLVLIEEPEAHLHVQVQQVFIKKAYSILRNHEKLGESNDFSTQLVISTHSIHIVREEEFANLRYFKRLPQDDSCKVATSKVSNLSNTFEKNGEDTKRFVTRYLQATHCELFFADGIIIVEGAAEQMMLPYFIRREYPKLNQRYITILNIGGSHSHRFESLIDKLALPTLVITDLDSAEPFGRHKKANPAKGKGLISVNNAITKWLIGINDFDTLVNLPDKNKIFTRESICKYPIRIAYQTPIDVKYNNHKHEALSRTFEDSLIYTNLDSFKNISEQNSGELIKKLKEALNSGKNFRSIKSIVFNELKKSNVKAEFALDLIYSVDLDEITMPQYIKDGLDWLESTLCEEQ